MRDINEIEYWISRLESGESSFQNYAKLADLYTIRGQMLGDTRQEPSIAAYSERTAPVGEVLGQYGDSEFLQAVAGAPAADAWAVMDELMETLQVVNRRTYDSVMRKLGRL